MKRITLAGAALLLATFSIVGWANRDHIDAYFSNDVGAPTTTEPAQSYSPLNQLTLHLAAAGDVGTGETAAYETAAAMDELERQVPYDALLLLGDNIYDDGDPALVNERVLDPFAPVLDDDTDLLAVLGNHDVRDDNGPAQAAALGMPSAWYASRLGDTLIVALDSNRPEDPEQRGWLESTLAESTAAWKIVIMHHPAYSAGWHGSDASVQDSFVPLFERYGVDLVLSGHDHDYQRSNEINGVTYVVSGAAAKLRAAGREDFTAVSWSTYSFVDLAIYPDRIQGQAIDHQGEAIDSFTITHPSR